MDFSQLKKEICDRIESVLACHQFERGQPSDGSDQRRSTVCPRGKEKSYEQPITILALESQPAP
jgi:hypothetical protein